MALSAPNETKQVYFITEQRLQFRVCEKTIITTLAFLVNFCPNILALFFVSHTPFYKQMSLTTAIIIE